MVKYDEPEFQPFEQKEQSPKADTVKNRGLIF